MNSRRLLPILIAVSLAGCATTVPPLELSRDHPANPLAPEAPPQTLLSPFGDAEPVEPSEDSAAPAMHDHGGHDHGGQPDAGSAESHDGGDAGHGAQRSDGTPHRHGDTE